MGFFGATIGRGVGSALGGVLGGAIGEKDAGSKIGGALGGIGGGMLPFATGGKVPGKKGKPVRALVHGGETILPVGVKPTKAQKAEIRRRGGKV